MSIELGKTFDEYLGFWSNINKNERTGLIIKSPLEIETEERFRIEGFDIEQLRSSQLARI